MTSLSQNGARVRGTLKFSKISLTCEAGESSSTQITCVDNNCCNVQDTSPKSTTTFFMPGKLTGFKGNTVAPISSSTQFNPLFYKDEKGSFEPLGNMDGIFLSDQKSIDAYPFGDAPVLNFNLVSGFNKLFALDYEYGNYYGIKFSIESNKNYTPEQLKQADKEDMFSAKITANLYKDKSTDKVDNSEGWFIQPDGPLVTPSFFFGLSSTFAGYTRTYNSTNSQFGTKLVACLRPEEPYLIAINSFKKDQPDTMITSLRRNLAGFICY